MADVERYDDVFLQAGAVALGLVTLPEVAAHWTEPSALTGLSTGALACHLGNQVVRAAELLPRTTDQQPLETVDEHYARSAWVTAEPEDPVMDRTSDEDLAVAGAAALRERVTSHLDVVRELLARGAASEVVPVPWQGWSLRRDDFLLTRMLEVVVHGDDLAVSVGVPTPQFPDALFAPVRDLLVRLAVHRHGQSAVVSTLARSERGKPISAF
ncbi:maleylpyruvate isomerase N-terminal domain-containing protein [Cellulomonas sp. URHE0023]|uniref:maleylpyruvate isomerase N-terminal domain-containing protein n=1 Tax=Cellulomonas sp. URHE0023 TaxID=1380354 RepID=UPI00048482D9|nr:maleylpyruvate isomerase N-terminal domain-containing protein [Cellulomonas sp. URHE0023]